MVELLLADKYCCTELEKRDRAGRTAMHYAASNKYTWCIDMLAKAGASTNCKDDVGRTPLWHAVSEDGSAEVNKYILLSFILYIFSIVVHVFELYVLYCMR